jgi:Copper transport outer membrane protein, MctB
VISFRFHLVSLVAVFFALGVGILAGTTVINRGIVSQLEERTSDLNQRTRDLEGDLSRLQAEVETWEAFGQEVTGPLVSGRLTGREVVIVTQDGTDDDSIAGVRQVLEGAGAELRALLLVSDRMSLESAEDRAELADMVGMEQDADAETLAAQTAQTLAERLALGPTGTGILDSLVRAGYLIDEGPSLGEEGLRTVGGPNQILVVMAGGPAASQLQPARFLVPLVEGLVRGDSPVAAAEPANGGEQEPPFVALLRSDGDVSDSIATQDNVDQTPGQIGLILALEDLLDGAPGHYGIKEGASGGLLPDL